MKCFICGSDCEYFTSFNYLSGAFCSVAIKAGIYGTDVYKCKHCGSVFSKTHHEMEQNKFEQLMAYGHKYWEDVKKVVFTNTLDFPIGTAPHMEEANFINMLIKNNLVSGDKILDYAAGSGHLGKILDKYFSINILNYEPFAQEDAINYVPKEKLETYPLVLNCAMFSTLTSLEPFDHLCSLVAKDGALLVQTLVKGDITVDYLNHFFYMPLNAAAPSNKGMQILMERFGFVSSCYSPKAKAWVWFREDCGKDKISVINNELLSHELYYKKGFVDYWK